MSSYLFFENSSLLHDPSHQLLYMDGDIHMCLFIEKALKQQSLTSYWSFMLIHLDIDSSHPHREVTVNSDYSPGHLLCTRRQFCFSAWKKLLYTLGRVEERDFWFKKKENKKLVWTLLDLFFWLKSLFMWGWRRNFLQFWSVTWEKLITVAYMMCQIK